MPLNVELKARCNNQEKIRQILRENNADFKGVDHQIDTYFEAKEGRLKLREGNIENALIHYTRENKQGPKTANITLQRLEAENNVKEILVKVLQTLVTVDKQREIYFIDNVKFHIDNVESLGTFVEIEAIDTNGTITKERLQEQCQHFQDLFGINENDLVALSYSDLLLKKT
jgi:adenylate cyclase, class 2